EEWPKNDAAMQEASRIASAMTRYDVARGSDRPVSDTLDRLASGERPRAASPGTAAPPTRSRDKSEAAGRDPTSERRAFLRGLSAGISVTIATLLIVAVALFATGCEERPVQPQQAAPLATPPLRVEGEFGARARVPSRDETPRV